MWKSIIITIGVIVALVFIVFVSLLNNNNDNVRFTKRRNLLNLQPGQNKIIKGNKYTIEGQLGAGNFGTVYAAKLDEQEEQKVVIKETVISYEPGQTVSDAQNEFNLAKLAHSIDSKHTAEMIDFEYKNNQRGYTKYAYIVQEKVNGVTLYDYNRQPNRIRNAQNVICPLLNDVGGLLERLNMEQNVFFKDLKSENIMVEIGDDGNINFKMIDYGLAQEFNSQINLDEAIEQFTFRSGTPMTMSAVQYWGKSYFRDMDRTFFAQHWQTLLSAVDIYALYILAIENYLFHDDRDLNKVREQRWFPTIRDKQYRQSGSFVATDEDIKAVINERYSEFDTRFQQFVLDFNQMKWCTAKDFACYTKLGDWNVFKRKVKHLCALHQPHQPKRSLLKRYYEQ